MKTIQITDVAPLNDRILLEPEATEETKTASGIIIPQTKKSNTKFCTVLAIGDGFKTQDGRIIPLNVKTGDRVLIPNHVGIPFELNNANYIIARENDIIAVV